MGNATVASSPLSATERAALDDPQDWERYTRWRGGADTGSRVGRSSLAIQGIYCAACAPTLERALRAVPGVVDAVVHPGSERAEVDWVEGRTTPSALIDAVRGAGYDAQPAQSVAAEHARLRAQRLMMWRLFVAAFCMMQVMMYASPSYFSGPQDIDAEMLRLLNWASWLLSLPVLLFSARPFFDSAWRDLTRGRIGMDVPVSIGIVVTFVASMGATFDPGGVFGSEVWYDSMTMFVCFLLAGRWLELRARGRTLGALEALSRRLPQAVERLDADGVGHWVGRDDLRMGDRVRILAGQAFPADGTVLEGVAQVDEALLTGESRPLARHAGEPVIAGSHNLAGPVLVRVDRVGAQTRYAQIVELMARAARTRPALARLADRVAGPFLVVVLLLAAAGALAWWWIDPSRAVGVAVAVLIVTCPCALALATPAAVLAASGALARRGILVQRLDAIEGLARIDEVVFDKTGTLTEDSLHVAGVDVFDEAVPALSADEALALAAGLAEGSLHPVSRAMVRALGPRAAARLHAVREFPGQGVQGSDALGRRWRLGSHEWVGAAVPQAAGPTGLTTEVWLAGPGGQCARMRLNETLRADAASAVAQLRRDGLTVHLLSGDREEAAQAMARQVGIGQVHARATPQDKLDVVRTLQSAGRRVAMIGDGLNDAPVLAQADVSMALGAAADLTRAQADFTILSGRVGDVVAARRIARRTLRVVRQNLAWAAGYNACGIPLALVGWMPPWLAGLGMAASSLLVVGNALRLQAGAGEP